MAKNNVIIPEVIEEIPLEKVIDNTLVKHNVTEAVIASLKEKYKGLKLSHIGDKEGYLEIKEAKKEVRKYGILTEKLCKAGREDAIKVQKLWLGKEKEILGKIAEVESPLEAEIRRFEDEEQRIEDERVKRQEEAYMQRQTELLKFGAVYANGCFNLNDVIYEADLIKEADEDVYQNSILVKYKIQYEKMNAAKVEEERIKAEREAELTRQREEFEKQQAIFKQQQEEFAKQQAEAARKEQESIKKEKEEERKVVMQKFNDRLEKLSGYVFNGMTVKNTFGQTFGTVEYVVGLSDEVFNSMVDVNNKSIEDRKKQEEEKRLEEIEAAKQEAIKREQARKAEEERLAEIKRKEDEAKKAEELAQSDDKTKWAVFMAQFNTLLLPEMRSGQYRQKMQTAKVKIKEILSL